MWNPESKETESGIHSVEYRIQDSLGFPYMGRPQGLKQNRQQWLTAWESGIHSPIIRANREFHETLQLGTQWLRIHFVHFLPYLNNQRRLNDLRI